MCGKPTTKMHKRAQYIDGKLIGEDGKEINGKLKPPPPPPPPPIEEDDDEEDEEEEDEENHPKRKNISISYETWRDWKKIKGKKNWDAIMIDALEIFHKIKKLEDVIIQIALQKPTIIQQIGNQVPQIPARTDRVIPRATPISHKKKAPFLDEIKALVQKLEDQGKTIRDHLKCPEDNDEEIKKFQKSEEELAKIKEEAIQRAIMRSKNG